MKKYVWQLLLLFCVSCIAHAQEFLPVAYKGRFRPLEAYAGQWLYNLYQAEEILPEDRKAFNSRDGSALALLWQLEFQGHQPWDNAPLFYLGNRSLKESLQLPAEKQRFSFNVLQQAIEKEKATNLQFLGPLIIYHYFKSFTDPANRSGSKKLELTSLSPGLWVAWRGQQLIVMAAPLDFPWHHLEPNLVIANQITTSTDWKRIRSLAEDTLTLLSNLHLYRQLERPQNNHEAYTQLLERMRSRGLSVQEITLTLESQEPLLQRLSQAGTLFKMLPGRQGQGEWVPLHALVLETYDPTVQRFVPLQNFTLYPDALYDELRQTYRALLDGKQEEHAHLLTLLQQGYAPLAGQPYLVATGKELRYPSWWQLKAETFYLQYPLTPVLIVLYGVSLLLIALLPKRLFQLALISLGIAFISHTLVLLLRCAVLERPPVSNMFETVLYVPWVTVLAGMVLYAFLRQRLILVGAALVACILLVLLQLTHLSHSLENVQPVLDSQYWLIIHVMMVVGSYGAFLLAGVLGHLYLGGLALTRKETPTLHFLAKCILQAMYVGVALLIPGTILGGVWAAESWGRFWDWDPKESWAFISICVYLIWIHAYTFQRIGYFGLGIGAIVGLVTISFTWYGVNYLLGTGLHSYGFGAGGEAYYFLFLLAELLFLGTVYWRVKLVEKKI